MGFLIVTEIPKPCILLPDPSSGYPKYSSSTSSMSRRTEESQHQGQLPWLSKPHIEWFQVSPEEAVVVIPKWCMWMLTPYPHFSRSTGKKTSEGAEPFHEVWGETDYIWDHRITDLGTTKGEWQSEKYIQRDSLCGLPVQSQAMEHRPSQYSVPVVEPCSHHRRTQFLAFARFWMAVVPFPKLWWCSIRMVFVLPHGSPVAAIWVFVEAITSKADL